jgi:FkbM family methyltransferase
MKQLMKNTVKKILHPLILRLGYHENLIEKNENLLENLYIQLKQLGFIPQHIVDVGANHGNWTRTALRHFPDAYYTLLEPQEWLKDSITDLLDKNKKISFNGVGVGSKKGSFKFTLVNRDDSSSFRFTDEEAKKHGLSQIEVPVVTLNEFIGQLNIPTPAIIKIDAEGLDLDVLEGASDFFGKTELFLVEAGVGLKDIKNSFLNVVNFMDKNGYRLFDITDLNRPFEPSILWLTELAFIKKGGQLDSHKINLSTF